MKRTFTSCTNSVAGWVAIGMLSACTVTVKDGNSDKPDSGAATDSSESSDESSESSRGDAGQGSTDEESSTDEDTLSVHLQDGGTETNVEGDGGAPLGRFSCGSRDVEGATVVDDDIDANVTWSGKVYVKRFVSVMDGAKVTIEPGTRIVMAVDSGIEFGWNSGAVTVLAEGTETSPITICGEEAEAGYWKTLIFGANVTSNSKLKHVLVSDGGSNTAAVQLNTNVHVENVQVVDSEKVGVHARDFGKNSSKLSVAGSGEAAVVLLAQNAVTNFPLGGEFEDNAQNHVVLDFDSIKGSGKVIVHDVGVPYLQARSVDVYESAVLEFEPGVVYRFASDADLEVGWNSSDPSLFIRGTEDNPVIFEGQADQAGYWQGVIVGGSVRTNSTISHLLLRNGGASDEFALDVRAAITLNDVTLEDNDFGAYIGAQGLNPASANLTITSTGAAPLTVQQPDALVTLPRGGTYTGNKDDAILIAGDTYDTSGTIFNVGVPYRATRAISVMDDSSITIEPGVVFEMRADTYFEFGWNSGAARVVAVGTEDEPIVFRGTDAVAGSWRGLYVNVNVTSNSAFEYVTVQHAGSVSDPEEGAAIYLRAAVPVSHCTFEDISGYGVILTQEANAALVTDNTSLGGTLGALIDLRN